MRSLSDIYPIVIIVLFVIIAILIGSNSNIRSDRNRVKSNYNELQKEYNGQISYLKLTNGELLNRLESSDKKLDSVLKIMKIKPKTLQNITVIHNHFSDTTIIESPVKKINDSIYSFSDTTKCFVVGGIVDTSSDVPIIKIYNREFTGDIYYAQHKERREYRFLGILWKWRFLGKKESKINIWSECGVVSANRIDIVK